MSFAESIRACFRGYLQFTGRASRSEFWWFVLFAISISIAASLLDEVVFPSETSRWVTMSNLLGIAMFVPCLAVGYRRMHDSGRPGWWLLLPQALGVLALVLLLLTVFAFIGAQDGTVGQTTLPGRIGVLNSILDGVLVAAAILAILSIWWLTRPSDPGPNRYGLPLAA